MCKYEEHLCYHLSNTAKSMNFKWFEAKHVSVNEEEEERNNFKDYIKCDDVKFLKTA